MFRSLRKEAKTLKLILYRNLYARPKVQKDIVEGFHRLFYDARLFGGTHGDTYWLGTPIYKCPMDLMVYQEITLSDPPTGLDVHADILMEQFPDQVNMVNIDIDGRKQTLQFRKGDGSKHFSVSSD